MFGEAYSGDLFFDVGYALNDPQFDVRFFGNLGNIKGGIDQCIQLDLLTMEHAFAKANLPQP